MGTNPTVIDLSLPCDETVRPFPGDAGFTWQAIATLPVDGCNSRRICVGSHFSTHVDAPFHMLADGKRLDQYPPDRWLGRAAVVDVRGRERIGPADLPDSPGAPFVLLFTGHEERRGDADFFDRYPELTVAAAEKLAAAGVTLVGIDSFTVDGPPYDAHRALMAADILIVENLTGLGRLPVRVRLVVAPLKLTAADGAPARVLAEFTL
jgi:arylformamidase